MRRHPGSLAALLAVALIHPARARSEEETTAAVIARLREERGFAKASESAKTWWTAFEQENMEKRAALIQRLLGELALRKASIHQFFIAFVWSDTNNIQANLDYLDYLTKRFRTEGAAPAAAPVRRPELLGKVGYQRASREAREWWADMEAQHGETSALLGGVLDQIERRGADLEDLFLAHVNGRARNFEASLHYLDYTRNFKVEKKRTRHFPHPAMRAGAPADSLEATECIVDFTAWAPDEAGTAGRRERLEGERIRVEIFLRLRETDPRNKDLMAYLESPRGDTAAIEERFAGEGELEVYLLDWLSLDLLLRGQRDEARRINTKGLFR
ncbi:MAG: hypothetical protein ACT4PV_11080 [Planctomycetaceae bacterium]